MKVGDLIRHTYLRRDSRWEEQIGVPVVGTILCVDNKGATTIKVLEQSGKIRWFPASYCEVISESR